MTKLDDKDNVTVPMMFEERDGASAGANHKKPSGNAVVKTFRRVNIYYSHSKTFNNIYQIIWFITEASMYYVMLDTCITSK